MSKKMNTIVVETEHLNLEIITKNHIANLHLLLSNPKVQEFFPKILNKQETEEFYEKIRERYKSDGFCFWAVTRKNDNAFIGICGLLKQVIDNKNEIEVGYRLLSKYWGNGYGTEAANGCIEYAKNQLNLKSIIALIRPINSPSEQVALNCGLQLEKETIFHSLPHHVYRIKF
jgi:RimJ/RimL family protein N-acetyltransferase